MGLRLPWGAIVSVWLTVAATGAYAQVSTQDSASVIIFPKVIANGVWDTAIQLSNGANRPTRASCRYVNAQLTNPDQPRSPLNPPLWISTDFSINLIRQQPTHWVASRGRPIAESQACNSDSTNCDAAGAQIGRVPELPENFIGELICVELDASGAPWSGNGLHGFATLTHLQSGEVVKYPGVGLQGFGSNDADPRLCLGGEPSGDCPSGGEYARCPSEWTVSHSTDYDDSAVDGPINRTTLTVVPCTQDFNAETPATITLNFRTTNEFEQSFSTATNVQCWADIKLAENDIFRRDINGGDWLQTKVSVAGPGSSGFMLVQQTEHEQILPPELTAVATTPQQDGSGAEADIIALPFEVQP